ncbi:tyrosine-type recombinase/integrase [Aliamphritea hakodatensis]|uniref:tyrosine-type recombinase/integrase n=1 Tax=Aliamphritea hakodatensis TaxID=2895352 RepID=UPI0022FD39EE|nr:tyrosine-type recombinase/integrase [Aliamphritea hakodatensis]
MANIVKPNQKAIDVLPRPIRGQSAIEYRIEDHPRKRLWRGVEEDSYGARISVNGKRICFTSCRGVPIRAALKRVDEDIHLRRNQKSVSVTDISLEEATELYVSRYIDDLKDSKGARSRQKVLHNLVLKDGQRVGDIAVNKHVKVTALAVMNAAKTGRSTATVNRIFNRYRKDLHILCDEGLLDVNPCMGIKLLKERNTRKRTLTDTEMQLHVQKALSLNTPQGHCQVLACALGCRIGEAMRMRWCDIQPDGLSVIIPDSKNGDDATYPLNSAARHILKQCTQWQINEFIFPSALRAEGYIAYPRASFNKIRAEVMAEAGTAGMLPEYWLHDTRRSFGSKCNAVNGDLRATQQLLNHKNATTTERYTHHIPEQLSIASERTVHALFGDLFNTPDDN